MLSRSSFGNISGRYFRIDTPWNGDTEGELVRYPDEPKKQGPPRRPGRRWSCRIENLSPGAPLLNIAPQLDLCVVAALPQPPRKCTVVAAVAAEQCAAYVCARAGGSHSSTVAWLHSALRSAPSLADRFLDCSASCACAGEKYVVRVRMKNALGWGKWSWTSKTILTTL